MLNSIYNKTYKQVMICLPVLVVRCQFAIVIFFVNFNSYILLTEKESFPRAEFLLASISTFCFCLWQLDKGVVFTASI